MNVYLLTTLQNNWQSLEYDQCLASRDSIKTLWHRRWEN